MQNLSSVTTAVTHITIFVSHLENPEIQPEVHEAKVLKQLITLSLSRKCATLVHEYTFLHYFLS